MVERTSGCCRRTAQRLFAGKKGRAGKLAPEASEPAPPVQSPNGSPCLGQPSASPEGLLLPGCSSGLHFCFVLLFLFLSFSPFKTIAHMFWLRFFSSPPQPLPDPSNFMFFSLSLNKTKRNTRSQLTRKQKKENEATSLCKYPGALSSADWAWAGDPH